MTEQRHLQRFVVENLTSKLYIVHEQWVQGDDGLVFVGIDDCAAMLRLDVSQLFLFSHRRKYPKGLPHAYPNLGFVEFYSTSKRNNKMWINRKDVKNLRKKKGMS